MLQLLYILLPIRAWNWREIFKINIEATQELMNLRDKNIRRQGWNLVKLTLKK